MISIGCVIWKRPDFADFVYESLARHTPHLGDGRAEFFFVANDPHVELLYHLQQRGYRHFLHTNSPFTADQFVQKGIGEPHYLNRVYRANNRVFSEATGDIVVLVHSDMAFSPGWLDALVDVVDDETCAVSQLIEYPPECNHEYGSIVGDFGNTPATFRESDFLAVADEVRRDDHRVGGMFIPFCVRSSVINRCGMFPEGNLLEGPCGDQALRDRYLRLGVKTVTAMGSVVYHFGRGEMLAE